MRLCKHPEMSHDHRHKHTFKHSLTYLHTYHVAVSYAHTESCMRCIHPVSLSLCSQSSPPSVFNIFWIVAATTEYFPNFCGQLNWRLWVCWPSLLLFLPLIPSYFSPYVTYCMCIYIYRFVLFLSPVDSSFVSFLLWSFSFFIFSAYLRLGTSSYL